MVIRGNAWGKYDDESLTSHHLAHHSADVAACFEFIISLPVIQARFEKLAGRPLTPTMRAQLTAVTFLHDAGKLHPGFQAKGWPKGIWQGPLHGHGAEGRALLMSGGAPAAVRRALRLAEIPWWIDAQPFVLAALSHHGRPLTGLAMHAGWTTVSTPDFTYDPQEAAGIFGHALHSWFPEAFGDGDRQELPDNPALQHLFAGLVALADWIGSDRDYFPFEAMFREDYIQTARKGAREALSAIRIDLEAVRSRAHGRTGFEILTGFAAPAPHQRAIVDLPLSERLIILEAETGAGKTEAAFWRFARLFEAGLVDGLYFALPTRAAALQLHGRVDRMLKRMLGAAALEAVLAVPGYLKSGEIQGRPLPNWQVRWDDDGTAAEDILAARWAAESTRRFLAAPVAVGTVDQAMLAGLQVKHAHLRAACLARSLLVIDEIHASSHFERAIQTDLLEAHLDRGGYALLMSATLGSSARARWLHGRKANPPSFADAVATPYPALWCRGAQAPIAVETSGQEKGVAMALAPGWKAEAVAERAIAAARAGAKVLVIRNTVKAAVAAWEAVRANGGEALLLPIAGGPALHHSRFASEDRALLDAAVQRVLSPGEARPNGGMIVIGSQTLEQSLDIDADFLITDLCPVDVLLQRLGRLHRHSRVSRPCGFEKPQCVVMAPDRGLDPLLAPAFENGLGAWRDDSGSVSGIYLDLSMLELTQRLIADHPQWSIPSMNRFLVESATHDEPIAALHAELGGSWDSYRNVVIGLGMAQAGAGRMRLLQVNEPFGDEPFPENEEKVRTRLGGEGIRLTLPNPIKGPFGETITALTLPAHWSAGVDASGAVTVENADGGMRIGIGGRWFRYDRRGLSRRL
ncbi:CRISPR-associated helicase/endonuclease Cas3 [Nitrospirillum viridazoti]|uniref:CRISPR-associated Cas3 family helicase n=1 Tax=Nitrospirillum amazonense TaxID=28077 RepID=A0A560IZI1_9PROT|nr:CRISPR-associated helicase/endonuclease Cas3 [Nitrospirillum amazonense]TWB64423.1 CRISPR-associated Cas3 family helicase [Nitrospirillum amazonense]